MTSQCMHLSSEGRVKTLYKFVVSIEFSPLSSVALTNTWYQLHNGDYTGIFSSLPCPVPGGHSLTWVDKFKISKTSTLRCTHPDITMVLISLKVCPKNTTSYYWSVNYVLGTACGSITFFYLFY